MTTIHYNRQIIDFKVRTRIILMANPDLLTSLRFSHFINILYLYGYMVMWLELQTRRIF